MKSSVRLAIGLLTLAALVAVFAPVIISVFGLPQPNARDNSALSATFGTPTGPSASHWLGVDGLGRDILSRTIHGARVAFLVALPATIITMLLGVTLGLVAGYRGGLADSLISRSTEVVLAIPYLLLAVGIAASCSAGEGCVGGVIRPGVPLVILVIAATTWPFVTRIVRNQTRNLSRSDFVASARAAGVPEIRILTGEILPNLSGILTVMLAVLIPQAILAEAALTFLGVGVTTETPSWGAMIAGGTPYFPDAWWYMLFPGLALLITVISCTVIADGLRSPSGRFDSGARM